MRPTNLQTFYRAGGRIRLLASLALSILFFTVAVGTATVQQATLVILADETNSQKMTAWEWIGSGQSLGYNFLVAAGLSILATYFLLRRHTQE